VRKPLYPLGESYEMTKFKFLQECKPDPPITEEILEKATNAACARFVGGVSDSRFRRRMRDLAQEFGFSCAEHFMATLSRTPGATWPFTDFVPAEWGDCGIVPEKPLPGGVVIR